jgi:hypothetical protein
MSVARWVILVAAVREGSGKNVELCRVLQEKGSKHAENFQYAILEVAGSSATDDDVKVREGHWKRVLGTYDNGYNKSLEQDADHEY